MSFASGTLLQADKKKAADLMFLTAAAYLFQNAQAFKGITKALILKHHAPYLDLSCKEIESAMNWRVFCLLEQQRSFARLGLSEILISGIGGEAEICVHKCGWTSKYAYAYLNLLEDKQLWPVRLLGLSISEAIEAAKNMPDTIPKERSIPCPYEYKHAPPEYRKDRYWSLELPRSGIGLCLRCVRSGSSNPQDCNHDF
ncbi:hypothetical protein EAF04_007148 [Stromatinia cepivora]|nr:hypothetical protein EAF04_007148 [Stromatinia cepivora]